MQGFAVGRDGVQADRPVQHTGDLWSAGFLQEPPRGAQQRRGTQQQRTQALRAVRLGLVDSRKIDPAIVGQTEKIEDIKVNLSRVRDEILKHHTPDLFLRKDRQDAFEIVAEVGHGAILQNLGGDASFRMVAALAPFFL